MRNKISLDDKYALDATRAYLTGIEALVRLPILQHQRDLDTLKLPNTTNQRTKPNEKPP